MEETMKNESKGREREKPQGKNQGSMRKKADGEVKRAGPVKPGRKPEAKGARARSKYPNPTPELAIDQQALKKIKLAAVAFSHVEREFFPTEEAYEAEREVEDRAMDVVKALDQMGIPARSYQSDQYFLTNLLVDDPNLVINLVDTLRGKDYLQTSVPGALELAGIPYTGAGMRGLVIGNDRNMFKQLLVASKIPTPDFQFIQRKGTKIEERLGLPLIVKLNESGGSVGIDNHAVKETREEAQEQVNEMIATYKMPVIVERFVDGPEITAVVFEDAQKRHVFLGQKKFNVRPDGKHEFTSIESYKAANAYVYEPVKDENLAREIERLASRAFSVLHNKDYSKFDIRVDQETGTPYFTDCNPNTAFGPSMGLPFTEVLQTLYGVNFQTVLASLMSKYARQIET